MPSPSPSNSASIEKGSSLGRDAWLRLKKNHLAMASLWFTVLVVLVSVVVIIVRLVSRSVVFLSFRLRAGLDDHQLFVVFMFYFSHDRLLPLALWITRRPSSRAGRP
jgi:hypothetical protein